MTNSYKLVAILNNECLLVNENELHAPMCLDASTKCMDIVKYAFFG